MEKKMTYVDALEIAISVLSADESMIEVANKLCALKDQQIKKSKSGSSKPTKRQIENTDVLQPAILDFLATVDKATATEVAKGVKVEFEVTTSRASANLKALGDKVVKSTEKRVSYFSLA